MAIVVPPLPLIHVAFSSQHGTSLPTTTPKAEGSLVLPFSAQSTVSTGPAIMPSFGGGGSSGQNYIVCS